MSSHPHQHSLLARLVAALYGIANALHPLIRTIEADPTRPWQQRTRFAGRLFAILRELLALTTQIDPASLSPTPTFPVWSPRPSAARRPLATLTAHPVTQPIRPLSARHLARRLATLLLLLEQLAREIGATLPATLRHHAARAATLAGCDALPHRRIPSWERAG